MTVTGEEIIGTYPSAGYDVATGLPQGTWRGVVRVTGDASAGGLRARLIFNQTGAPFNQRYFSLEQFGLENGVSTAIEYMVNTENMLGQFAIDNVVGLRFAVSLEDPIGDDIAPNIRDLRFPVRMFIGRQNQRLVQCFLQAQTPNILNTVHAFYAMGYFWDAGALNAPGGIKYPTNPQLLG